ncbi:hypothetical protein GGF31_006736 [Allomyces arbusculus]|nr:hypothetical protein GGF31_006736 [Allomyces arbusculus]
MGKPPARPSISAPVRASFVHVSSGTAPGAVSMLHALQPLPEHESRGAGEDEDVDVLDDNDNDNGGMARHAPDLAAAAAPPPATAAIPASPTFSTLADPLHPHESLLDRRRRRLDERAHLQQQQPHHHVPPPPPPLALATSPPHAAPLLLAGAPALAPPTTATTPTSATHHRRRRSRGSMMLLFSPTKPRASGLGNADTSDSDSDDAVRARLRSVISAPVAVAASSNPGAVPLGPTVHAPAPRSPVAAGVLARQRTLDESSDSDEADNDAAARLRALARVGITVTPPPGNGIPAPPPPTPAMLSPATQKKRKSPGVFRMLARTLADGFSSATRSSSSSTRGAGTLPRSGPPDLATPSSIRGSFDLAEEPRRVSISSPHLVAATARTVLAGVVPLAEAALRQQTTGFASLPRSTPPPPAGTSQRPRAAHPPPSPALRRRSMSFSDLPRLDAPHSMVRAASPARNAAHAVSAASPLVHVVEVDGEEETAPLPPRPPSRTSARTIPTGSRSRTPSGPRAAAAPPPPMPPPAGSVPPVPPMSPTTTATAHVTAVAVPVPAPLPPPPTSRSRSPAASRSRASTMPDDDAALDAAWLPPAHVTKRISLTPKLIADSDPGIDGGDAWRLPSWIGSDLDALAAGVGATTGGSSKRSLSRSRSSVVSAARSSLPPAAADVPTVAADGDTDAPPPTSPAAAAPPSADDVSRLESLMARTVDEERAMLASFLSSSTPAMTGGAPPTPPPEPVPKDLPPPLRRAASPSPPQSVTSPSASTKPRTLRDLLSAVAADVPGTLKRARSAGKGSKRASKDSAAVGPVLEPSSPKPAQEATMDLIAAYAGLCDDESPAAETAPAVEPVKDKEGGEEVDPEVAHLVAQIHRAMRDLDEDSPVRSTVGSPRTPVAAGP